MMLQSLMSGKRPTVSAVTEESTEIAWVKKLVIVAILPISEFWRLCQLYLV